MKEDARQWLWMNEDEGGLNWPNMLDLECIGCNRLKKAEVGCNRMYYVTLGPLLSM